MFSAAHVLHNLFITYKRIIISEFIVVVAMVSFIWLLITHSFGNVFTGLRSL